MSLWVSDVAFCQITFASLIPRRRRLWLYGDSRLINVTSMSMFVWGSSVHWVNQYQYWMLSIVTIHYTDTYNAPCLLADPMQCGEYIYCMSQVTWPVCLSSVTRQQLSMHYITFLHQLHWSLTHSDCFLAPYKWTSSTGWAKLSDTTLHFCL